MSLSEEARKLRREYQKQWRLDNPEATKRHQETYWERKVKETTKQQ